MMTIRSRFLLVRGTLSYAVFVGGRYIGMVSFGRPEPPPITRDEVLDAYEALLTIDRLPAGLVLGLSTEA